MKNSLLSFFAVSAFAFVLLVNTAAAETNQTANSNVRPNITNTANINRAEISGSIQELIKSLLERIKLLQGDSAAIKTEVKNTSDDIQDLLKGNIRMGTTSNHVRRIQELLAGDSSIYPRGLVTGYFGPMTEEAIKKFQEKYDLEVTGEINDETREALNTLFQERSKNGKVPEGWLKAPGLMKNFISRLRDTCLESEKKNTIFCKAMKNKHNWDDDEEDEEEEDDDNDDNSNSSTTMSYVERRADKIITEANELIADLEDAIEEAEEDADGLDEAEADLVTAKAAIEKAEDYFDEEKYVSATKKALDAKRAARSGLSELD